jgi:hypothetical protein
MFRCEDMASASWQSFLLKLHVRCACPNARFRQKLWPKTILVYFLTTFYVKILQMQRATHVPNVTEWHALGWTTPAINTVPHRELRWKMDLTCVPFCQKNG